MASFTVRVELHGATSADYERLHEAMEKSGFKRFVEGVDPSGATGVWLLPTAEYDYSSEKPVKSVRDSAKAVADSIRLRAWVLVTEVKDRSWHTEKVRSSN